MVEALKRLARRVSSALAEVTPGASRPAWERSVLDDIAARRPWNIRVKAERMVALRRLGRLQDGVTVVIVNWNTKDVTEDVVRAVRRLSPPTIRVLVVDNGSTDGSPELFSAWPGVESLLLSGNAGHGVALDIAMSRVTTKVAVTLDSDAIPLREGWLDQAVEPVRSGRAVLAGLRSSRDFVHPVFCAVDTAEFLKRRLSFQTFVSPGITGDAARWGENAWDTAELMTRRLDPDQVVFIDPTPNLVPGLPGMTTGGVVYHHGGVSRASTGAIDPEALSRWRSAWRDLHQASRDRTEPLSVSGAGMSVVIPVKNGAGTLAEQLEALAGAVRPAGDLEILVSDNGSMDGTRALAGSFADRLPVRVVDASAAPGSNYARNCGIRAAKYDRIALCDADDRVDAGWLVAMAKAFDEGHELIVGPIDYMCLNSETVRAWRGSRRAFAEVSLGFLPSGHGANMAFTRRLYERLGGFDDAFEFGGPDTEFCWRVQLAGIPLHAEPAALVHYRIRQSMPALAKQSRAYGAAEAHLYKKFHRAGLRRRSPMALVRELWWLGTRYPFSRPPGRRGAWVRRWETQRGRFLGALRYRVIWW